MGLAIGLAVGLGKAAIPSWVSRSASGALAVFDADYTNGRYWGRGRSFPDETSFNAAMGGTKSGAATIFGPYETETELFTNGTFDTDVSGWAAGGTGASIAWAAGELQLTSGGSLNCFSQGVSNALGRAFRMRGTGRRGTTSNSFTMGMATDAALSANTSFSGAISSTTATQLTSDLVPVNANPTYFGFRNTSGSGTGTGLFDNLSLKELVPFFGFPSNGYTVVVSGTAPASNASDEVLLQLDNNTDNIRIRLASGDSAVLDVRNSASVQVFATIGTISDGADFEVAFSAAQDSFLTALNGVSATPDTSGILYGTPYMRIGRAFGGNAFSGTIKRVTIL